MKSCSRTGMKAGSLGAPSVRLPRSHRVRFGRPQIIAKATSTQAPAVSPGAKQSSAFKVGTTQSR